MKQKDNDGWGLLMSSKNFYAKINCLIEQPRYVFILLTLCILMDFFLLVWYNKLGIVHCTYLGMSDCQVIILKKILYSFVWRSFLPWQTVYTLMKWCIMQRFIWVFTVCKSTCYGVSLIQRVNCCWMKGQLSVKNTHADMKFRPVICPVTC